MHYRSITTRSHLEMHECHIIWAEANRMIRTAIIRMHNLENIYLNYRVALHTMNSPHTGKRTKKKPFDRNHHCNRITAQLQKHKILFVNSTIGPIEANVVVDEYEIHSTSRICISECIVYG